MRQERAVAGHADDPREVRPVGRGPVEAGENAGERAGEIRHAVRHHGQANAGEAGRIAVGVENDARARRAQQRQHAVENGDAADRHQRLVAAAHAARQAAGEDEAEGRGMGGRGVRHDVSEGGHRVQGARDDRVRRFRSC